MSKVKLFVFLAVAILLLAMGASQHQTDAVMALPSAQVGAPGGITIPYPGRLTDEAGLPVADGVYAFTFTLYDAETGGQPVWAETQAGVTVQGGSFAALLGSASPLPKEAMDSKLWLQVAVRGPGESEFTALSPRQVLSTASVAPTSVTAGPACAHDHVGEWWTGDSGPSGNGLRVENTRTDGIGVTGVAHNGTNAVGVFGWTTQGVGVRGSSDSSTGVRGTSNSGPGVVGRSTNGYGVEGVSVSNDGVWAHSTDGYGLFAHSDNNHSIYVDGAGNAGLYIFSAGASGVYVASAASAGVGVYSAGAAGMWVHSAAQDGILVETAGLDGVHVTGPVGGSYYGSGLQGNEDFAVLNTGEVRSKVGFGAPTHGFAEIMAVEGIKTDYEPGDVLVAGGTGKGAVARSSMAYSRAVIGVYSFSPAFVGGQPVPKDQQANGVPVTILGMVQCKVSAENGPIRPGDLLITSATPGHAMRADDPPRGTTLGKALGILDSGTGLILVLVTLQ